MKSITAFFKQILIAPIGIGFSVVHWIVVFYAPYGETHSQPFHFYYEPLLAQWLFLLNSPAFILASLSALPFILIFGENTLTVYFGLFVYFIFITFQWLIIGFTSKYIIDSMKQKELNLSLFNE